jgi:twinkle protein
MNQPMPPFPIKCLADVEKVDLLSLPHISTGIKSLDRLIEGLFESQLIVVTGKRGQGKSTFASWLLSNALNQGRNIFAYSGELPDYHFRNWLDLQIAGARNIKADKNEWGDSVYSLNDDAAKKLTDYYAGRAYIYDNSAVTQGRLQDVLLGSIRYVAEQFKCQVVLVDNIMTAVDMLDNDAYAVQSGFVKSLKALCAELHITIILIAHPRKTEQGKALMNDDVSGTADITNLADIVLTYSRLDEKESENGKYHSAIAVTKNRLTGKLTQKSKPIKVTYSEMTKRIISDDDKEPNQLMCCFKNDYVPF